MAAKSVEAQRVLAALDAELADSAKRDGRDLVWSAAEQDILAMIGAAVDRRGGGSARGVVGRVRGEPERSGEAEGRD
jgi:hypothetical protein